MTSAEGVLARARQFLFVRENGANAGRWVEAIQRIGGTVKGQPWCACFVCLVVGIWLDGKLPFPFTASCDNLLEWARANKVLFDDPEPGDIFLVMKSANDAEHTGLVTEGITATHFGSIEGNASDPKQPPSREGFGVFERTLSDERVRHRGPNYKYLRWRIAVERALAA